MFDQLSDQFSDIFNTYLAAFRKGFGCQTTLLRLLEDWKRELDNHRQVGVISMDLSKAFDCLLHGLIFYKLTAYDLSSSSSSSSYIVQTPSGVYSYWRSAVQELSTVDLKT